MKYCNKVLEELSKIDEDKLSKEELKELYSELEDVLSSVFNLAENIDDLIDEEEWYFK